MVGIRGVGLAMAGRGVAFVFLAMISPMTEKSVEDGAIADGPFILCRRIMVSGVESK